MTDYYSAKHWSEKARKQAVGTITENPDGSAKYWAERAEAAAGSVSIPIPTVADAGKFLMTTGTESQWQTVEALPAQTGNAGKYLVTDGENASWAYASTNKIGEIIQMACTADYIPDGCLPCDGSEYSASQLSGLWSNFLTSNPVKLNVCSYEEYAADIATYGQCAKFAVNTASNTFKVPTIKDGSYITQALSESELGKSYHESLPNITGTLGASWPSDKSNTGAFKNEGNDPNSSMGGDSAWNNSGWASFDASRVSSTYRDGAKCRCCKRTNQSGEHGLECLGKFFEYKSKYINEQHYHGGQGRYH